MNRCISAFVFAVFVSSAQAGSVVEVPSNHDVKQTVALYLRALNQAGVTVLERRHQSGEVIVFNNPLFGTTMGRCHRGERKDIAMEARVWRDDNGTVWLRYEQPSDVINQFGVIECGHETDNMRKALDNFASAAIN